MKYVCPCGYEYDLAKGDPDNGIPPALLGKTFPRTGFVLPADLIRIPLTRKTDLT